LLHGRWASLASPIEWQSLETSKPVAIRDFL
jgi:hypothetical protein